MKTLALTSLLLAMVSGMASADPPKQRVPVDVLLVGDDGLTQNLSFSLKEGLRKHPSLSLAEARGKAVLTIRSKTHVGWDALGGRKVLIYTVFVGAGEATNEPITGVCYEKGISKCVKDILRIVSLESDRPLRS